MAPSTQDMLSLLAAADLPERYDLASLPGGGNNQVYRVDYPGGSALLKAYFRHSDDPRDRLGTEFAFCQFAWNAGLRTLPQPLACNREQGLGLYEFIHGRKLGGSDVGMPQVQEAIEFYHRLNSYKSDPAARALPDASEACFTLAEHLACVERRLLRLEQLDRSTPAGQEAGELVQRELAPRWRKLAANVHSTAARWKLAVDEPVAAGDRCLSPSDFGFHNALGVDGKLRFLDFEYAGWDDPAKMVCDFFSSPALPVPERYYDAFAQAAFADLSDPARQLARAWLLLPVYRVKWCCIMLNDFLPVGNHRRSFAAGTDDPQERKARQLIKVRAALTHIPH